MFTAGLEGSRQSWDNLNDDIDGAVSIHLAVPTPPKPVMPNKSRWDEPYIGRMEEDIVRLGCCSFVDSASKEVR